MRYGLLKHLEPMYVITSVILKDENNVILKEFLKKIVLLYSFSILNIFYKQ